MLLRWTGDNLETSSGTPPMYCIKQGKNWTRKISLKCKSQEDIQYCNVDKVRLSSSATGMFKGPGISGCFYLLPSNRRTSNAFTPNVLLSQSRDILFWCWWIFHVIIQAEHHSSLAKCLQKYFETVALLCRENPELKKHLDRPNVNRLIKLTVYTIHLYIMTYL